MFAEVAFLYHREDEHHMMHSFVVPFGRVLKFTSFPVEWWGPYDVPFLWLISAFLSLLQGLAYQLIDDVLDFTGTSASLGKGSLSDIRHVIHLCRLCLHLKFYYALVLTVILLWRIWIRNNFMNQNGAQNGGWDVLLKTKKVLESTPNLASNDIIRN